MCWLWGTQGSGSWDTVSQAGAKRGWWPQERRGTQPRRRWLWGPRRVHCSTSAAARAPCFRVRQVHRGQEMPRTQRWVGRGQGRPGLENHSRLYRIRRLYSVIGQVNARPAQAPSPTLRERGLTEATIPSGRGRQFIVRHSQRWGGQGAPSASPLHLAKPTTSLPKSPGCIR